MIVLQNKDLDYNSKSDIWVITFIKALRSPTSIKNTTKTLDPFSIKPQWLDSLCLSAKTIS